MPKLEIHDPQDFISMEVFRDPADDLHHRLVYIIAMEKNLRIPKSIVQHKLYWRNTDN